MLGSFNNWNIVQFTNKATSSEDFDVLNKLFLDGICDIMASLVQLGKYCDINAADPTTMVYYVIIYLSDSYTLQTYQITYSQTSNAGEILFKA